MSRKIIISNLITAVIIIVIFAIIKKQDFNKTTISHHSNEANINTATESQGYKTYTFDNFHGSTDISDKFSFQYPANWYSDGQYFGPQKVEYYDMFTGRAPIYFDLVLTNIFSQTELQYQINHSKRKSPDATGEIDGKQFKKYDLIDYGSYGGDSAGRVKIFVGPKITIDGTDYYLVFHWEEKPLAENMSQNDVRVFDNIMLSLKFFQ